MKNSLTATAVILALAGSAAAGVVDSSAGGFSVKTTLQIQAPPQDVYRRLLAIGEWWGSDHTFSGDARNMSLEARPGGCWCEKLAGGGALQHMQVIYAAPGKLLRMTGALGPLQEMAVTGTMTIQLTPAEGGTKLDMTYAVGGYSPAGLNTLAAIVDSVLAGQFGRLKNSIERGDPAAGQKSSITK